MQKKNEAKRTFSVMGYDGERPVLMTSKQFSSYEDAKKYADSCHPNYKAQVLENLGQRKYIEVIQLNRNNQLDGFSMLSYSRQIKQAKVQENET